MPPASPPARPVRFELRLAVCAGLLLCVASGCKSDPAPADAGPRVTDGGTSVDGGPTDLGMSQDSGPPQDLGSPQDAGADVGTSDLGVASGLGARPSNPTCYAPLRPGPLPGFGLVDAYPTAPAFSQPVKALQAPGDGSRWFVLEKSGRVRVFDVADPSVVSTYIDISSAVWTTSEGGLLGMAFHPDFPNTPEVYLSYTGFDGADRSSFISRFVLDDANTPTSVQEQVLLIVEQDFNNHNGGDIAFGPDGYLYIGLGDGGSGGDPLNRAQDTRRLLGSMLRIDVVGVAYPSPGYQIPADNPFAGNPRCGPAGNMQDCPEIFAWGLRNPWRFSFDPATGNLWAGDVGQNNWEEIDIITLGGNYGWRCREGAHDFNTAGCASVYVDPVAEYGHSLGQSITGGYVYRGSAIPDLVGHYIVADYVSGRIWSVSDVSGTYELDQLLDTAMFISAFGLGDDGELYVVDYGAGRLRRLVQTTMSTPDPIPTLLSETGCVDPSDPTQPAPGLIPYDVNALFWSDGAEKHRYLAIPDGRQIRLEVNGDWTVPNGSVLMKHFRIGGRLVETRLLIRHYDGVWAGYTYEWNAAQTDATRVRGGAVRDVDGQDWIFPSEGQCLACHTAAAGVSLGLETAQLNGDATYPSTGITAHQLVTLDAIGLFSNTLPGPPESLPALVDPADTSASLDERARAYLHTNCAQCHRPGGPTPSDMDLRFSTALTDTASCDVAPTYGGLGLSDARIIAPGAPDSSVLLERMTRRDIESMPPLGSTVRDTDGEALIRAWIQSLACP